MAGARHHQPGGGDHHRRLNHRLGSRAVDRRRPGPHLLAGAVDSGELHAGLRGLLARLWHLGGPHRPTANAGPGHHRLHRCVHLGWAVRVGRRAHLGPTAARHRWRGDAAHHAVAHQRQLHRQSPRHRVRDLGLDHRRYGRRRPTARWLADHGFLLALGVRHQRAHRHPHRGGAVRLR